MDLCRVLHVKLQKIQQDRNVFVESVDYFIMDMGFFRSCIHTFSDADQLEVDPEISSNEKRI